MESEDIVSGHLQGRHGLVDVLVQAVVLHRVPGTQTIFPAPALSQEEDLKGSRRMSEIEETNATMATETNGPELLLSAVRTHLPLVVVGDVNDGHQESQDDQMKEEVGVLVL